MNPTHSFKNLEIAHFNSIYWLLVGFNPFKEDWEWRLKFHAYLTHQGINAGGGV